MVKLESLKKSNQFKKALKEKRVHTDYFSIFAAKNFFKAKLKTNLLISFVMKKKLLLKKFLEKIKFPLEVLK